MVGTLISFHHGQMTGRSAFACGGTAYEAWHSEPQGLFQGGLSADMADSEAKTIGFANPATSYRVTCDSGLFEFHQAGADLVTAFDIRFCVCGAPENSGVSAQANRKKNFYNSNILTASFDAATHGANGK